MQQPMSTGMEGRETAAIQMSLEQIVDVINNPAVWDPNTPKIKLQLVFRSKVPDYDYRKMDYFQLRHPGDSKEDIYNVNEHLAVLLAFVSNILVLLVFLRVLGLSRLPSRIVVSLAVANLVGGVGHAIHTTSVGITALSDGVEICRFVTMFVNLNWVLHFNCLSSAIVERIIACNMPTYYSRASHIFGPVILLSPWIYWLMNLILLEIGFYDYHMGYQCSSHLNAVTPQGSYNSAAQSSSLISFLLLCGMLLSLKLHNHSSGDVWETNRLQFELRTTAVLLKVTFVSIVMCIPMLLTPYYRLNGLTYSEYKTVHGFCIQLSVHKGLALVIVLMGRKEFRRHLVLVFESTENIRRTRTTNLLMNHGPSRNYSARLLRFSDGGVSREVSTSEAATSAAPRARNDSSLTQHTTGTGTTSAATGPYLESRDKVSALQTPDWLRKKESKVLLGGWSAPHFLSLSKVFHWSTSATSLTHESREESQA